MNKPNKKVNPHTFKRIMKTLIGYYPVLVPVTVFCILFSAIAAAIPDIFIQKIIAIIEVWQPDKNWTAAVKEITPLMVILISMYVISIIAVTVYSELMAFITQGFLSKLRISMFGGMQNLPIKYFDTNKHGDIMSYYTNDIDTLRQLISQSMPALIRSIAIVIGVFFIMLYYSVWMTLLLLVGVTAMMIISKKVGGGSAKYFIKQQQSIGKAEGFIQEMMNGQKVIKVFNHEEECISDFEEINTALCDDSCKANAYANILGPNIMNIGNIIYVLIAVAGGLFLLSGVPNISISVLGFSISIIIPFLNMTKQFTGNINQLSQQINSIVMGLAGAERIFALMDETPETDDGYVTLVNANIAPDGTFPETDKHTG